MPTLAPMFRLTMLAMAAALLPAATAGAQTAVPTPGPTAGPAHVHHVVIPQNRGFTTQPGLTGIRVDRVDADVRIVEQTARTRLDIFLSNPGVQRAEAVILLPVPDGAAVSGFAFEGAASTPTAVVLPRGEARRVYDDIVAQVRDPALLEFAGYNLIKSSVFPIEPGGTQRIRLTYEHLLPADGDRVDYILPRSESLDVRTPWTITASVESTQPISTVYSPSHAVAIKRANSTNVTATAMGAQVTPGSFRLSYLREGGTISASLFAYPDTEVGGGYFLLMAGLPASIDEAATRQRREVTLVLDRSGSMAGGKLDQVRAAALQVIEGLDDDEFFNIIDYSTRVASFAPGPVAKTPERILAARTYLASLRPNGGTNIHAALASALAAPPSPDAIPMVLFLTDGLPTVGETREVSIRSLVETQNPHERRVFTFGVGADVNVPLLDRIAEVTRGTSTNVLAEEDVELKVAKVFQQLHGPVLSNVSLRTLDSSGAVSTRVVRDLIPERMPDLFEGDQLILLGQYQHAQPVTFELSGTFLGTPRMFTFTFGFERAAVDNAFVPRLWASRRIAFLVDQIRQAGASTAGQPATTNEFLFADPRFRELTVEILRLSTRFGILTEYTAFLAREGTDLTNKDALIVGCGSLLQDKAVRTRWGFAAVNQGLNVKSQSKQTYLNPDNRFVDERMNEVSFQSVQQVCDRAFFQRDGQWIDARLIDRYQVLVADETVMFGSPRHGQIIRELVAEGRQGVLAFRNNILMLHRGRIVQINNGC